MKVGKFGVVAFVVGLGALLFSSQAARAGDQDFTLVNKTGVSSTRCWCRPTTTTSGAKT